MEGVTRRDPRLNLSIRVQVHGPLEGLSAFSYVEAVVVPDRLGPTC